MKSDTSLLTMDLHFLNTPKSIAAFLLETEDGPILFETGPHSTYKNLVKGIQQAGYQPEDIRHIFISHVHLDHAGAAWTFGAQGATIYVHPLGEKHLKEPQRLMESARRIYQNEMDRLWGQMNPIAAERLITVENGQSIIIGGNVIRGWHTPGHAIHHIAWQIRDVMVTGDVAGVAIGKGPVVPPCPPPDINIEDWQSSIQLLRSLNLSTLYLTHFGKVTSVDTHLDKLEKRLLAWANWIKPYYEEGVDMKVVTPKFQQYVMQELKSSGVAAEELESYDKSNPPWMSVAGLYRYWKKKQRT